MNAWGHNFRISIFGESHGRSLGILIDGCPAGIRLSEEDFNEDIDRRRPKVFGTTARKEEDKPSINSGVFNGFTTGAPILIEFQNNNIKSKDYQQFKDHPRPGHADWVAIKKFKGYNDYRGGGHFSGRLTLAIVAAGVIAKKILSTLEFSSKVVSVGGYIDYENILKKAIQTQDSLGGIVQCEVQGVPIGLGEPFFDAIESSIAHLAFSIPGIKGIEFGSGFEAANMKGSEFNDLIVNEKGETETNHSGGINGGISNGNTIVFRLAVRPTSSIAQTQSTFNLKTKKVEGLSIQGRHDACIALRVSVIAEAIAAIALSDAYLNSKNESIS
ncbi:MAG: chorismate synthase [Bacteroidales bacterium]|nr:chorismate synthase [Bacteroidales bacterium]